MIHTIKNNKWVIAMTLICVLLGALTFFTFINQSFIKLNDFNLQILLFIDAVLLVIFFVIIFHQIYKIVRERKKGKLGSETSLRYIVFFISLKYLNALNECSNNDLLLTIWNGFGVLDLSLLLLPAANIMRNKLISFQFALYLL